VETSPTLTALATALAAAQGEIENASKNAANPHFKSRYADLAEILNTARPVLARHGLSVVQSPGYADGLVSVTTMLLHSSGEWLRDTVRAPAQKADPQGVGSATTYLRRYSLAALVGIAQEDDDGEAAVERRPAAQSPTRSPSTNGKASDKQTEYLDKLMKSSVFTDDERQKVAAKCGSGDRVVVSSAIEWAKTELDARKAAA
jgi:hypothetical protein